MKLLLDFKKKFDKEINIYLYRKIEWAQKLDHQAVIPFKIIRDFINQGGKKLRPALFFYAYKSYSSKDLSSILKQSLVYELIQTVCLIHDDIIDNSDLRRNQETVHKKYDRAIAILAGDLALMLADEVFMENKNITKVKELYDQLKQEVLIGQYLDYVKIADTNKIMELKTARYSFVRPALIGLVLAGVDKNEILKWEKILRETGILFQLKDDYIGTFGDEKTIGKSIISDFAEKKNTIIVDLFKKYTNKNDLEKFNKVFGNRDNFNWYLELLRKQEIDFKVQQIIKNKGETILKELEENFKSKLLANLLKEIIFNILEF